MGSITISNFQLVKNAAGSYRVFHTKAERFLESEHAAEKGQYDIIFMDPPYELSNSVIEDLLQTIITRDLLQPRGIVAIERESKSAPFTWSHPLEAIKYLLRGLLCYRFIVKRVVCPGSFDPITFGHLDIIERASKMFDEMISEVTAVFPNVRVDSWSGLLVDYCEANQIDIIVKGLRAVTDFDYELQMSQINLQLKGIETLFMSTAPAHSFLSSSLVKEIASYNGDVSNYIPAPLLEKLKTRLSHVHGARGVPLSASCVVHRGELLELLDGARNSFPHDFALAQQIIETREQILEEARISADALIAHGREEVARMVEQTEIVSAAHAEAKRILAAVEEDARAEREEIEAYIDSRLATLEVILNKTLDVVHRGREKLQGFEEKHILSDLAE
eukprot:gene1009-1018_t